METYVINQQFHRSIGKDQGVIETFSIQHSAFSEYGNSEFKNQTHVLAQQILLAQSNLSRLLPHQIAAIYMTVQPWYNADIL